MVIDRPTNEQPGPMSPVELETPTRRGDVIAAFLCLAAGLVGYFLVVPAAVYVPAKFAGTANSPAFLPKVMFIVLIGLSAIYLAQSLALYLRKPHQGRARTKDWVLAGGTALICIGYIAAIYVVGMTLGAALIIVAMTYYFGERRPLVMGAIAIILPVLLWYFFEKIAYVLFPTPWFSFTEWLGSAGHLTLWIA